MGKANETSLTVISASAFVACDTLLGYLVTKQYMHAADAL